MKVRKEVKYFRVSTAEYKVSRRGFVFWAARETNESSRGQLWEGWEPRVESATNPCVHNMFYSTYRFTVLDTQRHLIQTEL